jgi:RHS repeat-associated protein
VPHADSVQVCVKVDHPAAKQWMTYKPRNPSQAGEYAWWGSLITGGRDASGQMYMRNRYYDPGSGRFTQEDPIGLAGGLNLYGFAGGDPVNFSDPYGLKRSCIPACLGFAYAGEALALTGLGTSLAVLASTVDDVEGAVTGFVQLTTGVNLRNLAAGAGAIAGSLASETSDARPYAPPTPLPRAAGGQYAPDSEYPHTQLGTRESRKAAPYTQGLEFGADGRPIRRIDHTDHGRPQNHTNPHQHPIDVTKGRPGEPGKAEPVSP